VQAKSKWLRRAQHIVAPHRLQQIVWNLLSNAIKFTPKGGKIEILLERINSHVEITVSDTGQGIARLEDRTRAMMAGYQVHLSKPVEAQELVATVANLTGRTGA
jgi:signal transduction histidine kinase